ncbi:MAG: nitrate- and nitrite sensing domain-containing protein [Magnetococcales bacterium]|nr:nitrate- and nitrite sensing domain-containing protein [Magnetococcales bacterium]
MNSTSYSSPSWLSMLDRLSLKQKFALMLIFPIAGMLFFSISGVLEKKQLVNQTEAAQGLVKFAVLSSALIHETQKERGMTAGFLGSQGKKFIQQLPQHRQGATDPRIKDLKNFLTDFDHEAFGPAFSQDLSQSLLFLDELGAIRKQVDALSISTPQALGYYTRTNRGLLKVVSHISKVAPDTLMANLSVAYLNFLQAKERAGVERAVVTNSLIQGGFAPGMYQRFADLVTQQKTYLAVFRSIAPAEQIRFFDEKMQQSEVADVAHMRQILFREGKASDLKVLLSELFQKMALRGIYHSFKNLLIRGSYYGANNQKPRPEMQARYKSQFEASFTEAKGVIEAIFALPPEAITAQQRKDVQVVWENMLAYQKTLDTIITLQNEGSHLYAIDFEEGAGVRIDDQPADEAIDRLVESTQVGRFGIEANHWFKTISTKISLLKEVEDHLNEALAHQDATLHHKAVVDLEINLALTLFNTVAALFFAFVISRGILQQLGGEPEEVSQLVQRIASGDLTGGCDPAEGEPATGIVGAMNEMTVSLCAMLRGLGHVADDLNAASQELDNVAKGMSEQTGEMQGRSQQAEEDAQGMSAAMDTVSSATEETSTQLNQISTSSEEADANLQTIAAAAEEANVNLSTVAAAAEEASTSMVSVNEAAEKTSSNVDLVTSSIKGITASFAQVREQCVHAGDSSQKASKKAEGSIDVMSRLSESAKEVNSVVEVINNIAEQTNMLALNASIEAAGAGEAGKGFAVVANEVKDLARQTGEATKMISEKIQIIQSHTREVASVTTEVTGSIQKINQSNQEIIYAVGLQEQNVERIASAMERASVETKEVDRLVGESSEGISEVTRNVTELSQGIDEVTQNVSSAASGVREMSVNVAEISQASSEVAEKVAQTARTSTEISNSMAHLRQSADSIRQLSETVNNRSGDMGKLAGQLAEMLQQFRM